MEFGKRTNDYFLNSIFSACLFVPLAIFLFADSEADYSEKRALAARPPFVLERESLRSFPRAYERYVNDHMGLRAPLLNFYGRTSALLFGVSGSNRVLLGKDGWLFFAQEHSIEDIRRTDRLSSAEKQQWRQTIEEKEKWLTGKGITYRFLIPPDKHSIYPEMLPDNVSVGRGKSRLEDLMDTIQSTQVVINLHDSLFRSKSPFHPRLYYLTDTHWTSYGAYRGYKELINSLGEGYSARAIQLTGSSFHPSNFKELKDLALFARLPVKEPDEVADMNQYTRCQHSGQSLSPLNHSAKERFWTVTCDTGTGTALVFSDSFGGALVPYLSYHFARAIYLPYRDAEFFVRMVEQEKPDVVIEERVERLMKYPPNDSLKEALIRLSSPKGRGYTSAEETARTETYQLIRNKAKIREERGMISIIVNEKTWATSSNSIQGTGRIESIVDSKDLYFVRGWTAFGYQNQTADYVVVTKGEDVVFIGAVNLFRPDIAVDFDKEHLRLSGFELSVPKEILASHIGRVRAFAVRVHPRRLAELPLPL